MVFDFGVPSFTSFPPVCWFSPSLPLFPSSSAAFSKQSSPVFPQFAGFPPVHCLFQAVRRFSPGFAGFSPALSPFPSGSLPFPSSSLLFFTQFHWFSPSSSLSLPFPSGSLPFPSSSLHIFLWFAGFPLAHPSFIIMPLFYIVTYILRCIHSVVMALKLNHIPTLDGTADYPSWSKSIL